LSALLQPAAAINAPPLMITKSEAQIYRCTTWNSRKKALLLKRPAPWAASACIFPPRRASPVPPDQGSPSRTEQSVNDDNTEGRA